MRVCMEINWSAVRNKMLLGEQLLDKVQVVAVFGGNSSLSANAAKLRAQYQIFRLVFDATPHQLQQLTVEEGREKGRERESFARCEILIKATACAAVRG